MIAVSSVSDEMETISCIVAGINHLMVLQLKPPATYPAIAGCIPRN